MSLARHRTLAVASMLAAMLGTAVVTAGPTGAQEEPATEAGQVRDRQAMVSVDMDIMLAEGDTITAAIGDLAEHVEAEKQLLTSAELTLTSAQSDLAAADAAVADTQARLNEITLHADAVVIDSFVNPPSDSALDALTADSLEDATVKQTILDAQADANAELLGQYEAAMAELETEKAAREEAATAAEDATVKQTILDAQADANAELLGQYEATMAELETEKAAREEAAAAAEDAKAEAEAAYADVEAAVGQQASFAVEVQRRLDHRLAEADALANVDPALAEEIRAREAEVALALSMLDAEVQAERARARAAELAELADANKNITGIKPVPGGVVDVACPDGGTVQVAGAIAGQIERLLGDAAEAGYTMCGYGYRDPAEQIAVRRANCGTSNYAIYQAPSSACRPPTARPGTSMHEQGLAIDFTVGSGTIGSTSGAYRWLKANGSNYGMYNLPGEPWHWSVDGN